MPQRVSDPDQIRRELQTLCEHSLYDFAWHQLNYKAMHPGLHRDVICPFLTEWKEGKDIKILLIPREHLKSTLASISLPLWLWTLDPEKHDFTCGPETRFLMAHGKRETACDFLKEIKFHHIENETYRWVNPHVCFDNPEKQSNTWKYDSINVRRKEASKTPSMKASGTTSSVVGFHFDYALFDDLVFRENVGTPELRQKTYQYWVDCQALIRRGGKQLIIGTRWHNDDMYGRLLDPDGDKRDIIDPLVLRSGYFEKKPIFPVSELVPQCGFDMERLQGKLDAMGSYDFFAQYENAPQLDKSTSFVEENLKRFRLDYDGNIPNGKPAGWIMAVDPNRTTKVGNDPCAVTVAGITPDDHMWAVEGFRGHPTRAQLVDIIIEKALKWNVSVVLVESTAGQEYIIEDLEAEMISRDLRSFRVIPCKRGPTNRKDDRIMSLQAPSERHQIHLHSGDYFDEAVVELTNYGVAKHDDISDTLADIWNNRKEVRPLPPRVAKRKSKPKSPFLMASLIEGQRTKRQSYIARRQK